MNAYRWSVKLKLALIVFAVLIALASLAYTRYLVDSLREREQSMIRLWADAQEQVAQAQAVNPYQDELAALDAYLRSAAPAGRGQPLEDSALPEAQVERFRSAVAWAQSMPPASELNFITNNILIPNSFGIPAIITDSASQAPLFWRNVNIPEALTALPPVDSARAVRRLGRLRAEMDNVYQPIAIALGGEATAEEDRLMQFVHYDESRLIKDLRWFPYIQLLFVSLFVGVGYLGFSYVRRSEQSSLWAGMAREAAHQLGTPISSLMGWTQLLRDGSLSEAQRDEALDEIENDIVRLQRVTSRFSDIGSMPKLKVQPVAPVVERTVAYIRRRVPQAGQRVTLTTEVPPGLRAPLNAELFEWVIENLLKNALDAMDEPEGSITIEGRQGGSTIILDVRDTGRGIERRQWKNVFRPGYSTKKRGWGLGLSLAHRIVDDYHGGALSVAQSKVGEGTTFRIELPAA